MLPRSVTGATAKGPNKSPTRAPARAHLSFLPWPTGRPQGRRGARSVPSSFRVPTLECRTQTKASIMPQVRSLSHSSSLV